MLSSIFHLNQQPDHHCCKFTNELWNQNIKWLQIVHLVDIDGNEGCWANEVMFIIGQKEI